jgi:hypothetical protein
VAQVCRRLDGLPLAIELAAARSRLLTPVQIAERLEETLALPAPGHGGVERHQTMRAALLWSYELLSEAEQVLFRRLAVFRSSFILEAAAAVAPAVGDDMLSVLGGLVDKSLVVVVDGPTGEHRFRLLEPARQFAAELLVGRGEQDDAARRHRDHLLSHLRTRGLITPGSAAFEELAVEVDNLRAAVDHSMRSSEPAAAIELITTYVNWWVSLGLQDELVDRLAAALRPASPTHRYLSYPLSVASNNAAVLGRLGEAAEFNVRLDELRHRYPDKPYVQASWAESAAFLELYGAGGNFSYGIALMRQSQHAWETYNQPSMAARVASNIPLAAIPWDATDHPEVARAIRDSTLLAETAGFRNTALMMHVVERVIQVMGGASDAYPSCLDAFAELDAFDRGWAAEWGGLYLGVAAELVGDHRVTEAHTLRWVRFCRRSGVRMMLNSGIRSAARLSVMAGHAKQARLLWGGAEHLEAVTSMRYMPLIERLDRPLRHRCAQALGSEAAPLLAEGASWSVAETTQAAEAALLSLQADNELEPR